MQSHYAQLLPPLHIHLVTRACVQLTVRKTALLQRTIIMCIAIAQFACWQDVWGWPEAYVYATP